MHQLATTTSAEPSLHNVAVGYGNVEDLVAPLDIDRRFWYVELSAERGAIAPSAIFTMT